MTADSSSLDLRSLFETSRLFNSTYDLSFIAQHILRTLMGKLLAGRCSLHVFTSGNSDQVTTIAKKGLFKPDLPETLSVDELGLIAGDLGLYKFDLISNENKIGFLLLGKSLTGRPFSEQEMGFIEGLLQFASGALENSIRFQEIKSARSSLAKRVQELKTLFELSKEINGLLEPRKVYNLFSLTVLGQGVFNGVTLFHESADGTLDYVYHKGLGCDRKQIQAGSLLSDSPVLVGPEDNRLSDLYSKHQDPVLVIPLKTGKKGILVLKRSSAGLPLTEADVEFYLSLAHLLELTCTNIANFNESLLKQQMENELSIARDIQMALLPSRFSGFEPLDIFGTNESSKQVGGDYFDVFRLDKNRILVAIADVTGKGTPASLLMANLQSMIRILVQFPLSLSEMTGKINDIIYQNTAADKFITFFWGIIDTEQHKLTYVNAGHNPPYLLRHQEAIELTAGGVILGIMPSFMPYEMGEIDFSPGERLFIFTDGVTEAMSPDHEEFGEEALIETLKQWTTGSAKEITGHVLTQLSLHAAGAPQSDDITIIAVQWPES